MTQQYIFNPDVKTTAGTSRELYILGNVKYCAVDGTFMGGMPIINNGIEYTVGYTEDGNLYVTPIRVGTIYF